MNVVDLLTPDRVVHQPAVADKTQVLEILSDRLASATPGVTAAGIFASLSSRERLGSTGLGQGVAIPHGRPKGAAKAAGALIKLERGVEYNAPDGKPVDILFALLMPEDSPETHLEFLAQLAALFADRPLLAQLRSTRSAAESLALFRRGITAEASEEAACGERGHERRRSRRRTAAVQTL
jgi:PTS system nitrogen regulatory IIA component